MFATTPKLQNIPTETWVGCEVITETGVLLGWVRQMIFDVEAQTPIALSIATLPILRIPEILIGSYTLPWTEIVSSPTHRLIAFEGSEERLFPQTIGWLERLGLVRPPWFKEKNCYTVSPTDSHDDEEGGTGLSPVPVPRRPSPTPMSHESEPPRH